MSDQPLPNLKALLEECNLLDQAKEVGDSLFELQWGSALIVAGIKGRALVIISPMFKTLPEGQEDVFCRRLLELNSSLGGVASFAIQPDGWVVLHGGRDTKGMDAEEFLLLLSTIAQQADHYDNLLLDEFYAPPSSEDEAGQALDNDDPQPQEDGSSPPAP